MIKFKTPFDGHVVIKGEDYTDIKSVTQPEQVLSLPRIIQGIKNGTIFLDNSVQHFDIPEHEIDVEPGKTPEITNANYAASTLADLAESANKAGEFITAHPGFQVEDAQDLVDSVEAAYDAAKAAIEGVSVMASRDSAPSKSRSVDLGQSADGSFVSGVAASEADSE